VKLFYNNADRLARWWVSDYIELDKTQREYFDTSADDILYWHRTTQLADYRRGLLELANTVESAEMDREELVKIVEKIEGWGVAVNSRAVPVALDILLALSPQQRQKFANALSKSNRDYVKEAKRKHSARAEDEAKDYAWLWRKFVGRLSTEQRALISKKHFEMLPDAKVILDYRVEWQSKLLSALNAVPPKVAVMEDLMVNFDAYYTPEFTRMIEVNELVYQALTLELLASLTETQRGRMASELREYAELCQELISEAPLEAPPLAKALPAYSAQP
jgi:hypothetical protein